MLIAAKDEWSRMWPLPIVAMLGVAGAGIFTFSSGVFMGEMTKEFGWTKSAFSSALLAPLLVCLFAVPFIGRLIDRVGPRRIVLAGIIPAMLGTALLGAANGQLWQWWALCFVQACGAIIIVPPVWLTAIVSRFDVSRGLALAVGLAGTGVGGAVWPLLAAFYVEQFGWRFAYSALALSWGALVLPLAFFFFHSVRDTSAESASRKPAVSTDAAAYRKAVLSRTFLFLTASGGLMICICYGLMLHFVPILRASGMSLGMAASLAGLVGLSSICGRLIAGVLLDLVPTRLVAILIFVIPIIVSVLLIQAQGSIPLSILAAVLLGLATGSESDILTYVTSRRFDPAMFGSLYSVIQTVLAVTSISGSIIASALFDWSGSYTFFLLALIPFTLIGMLLIALAGDTGPRLLAKDDN